MPWVCRLPPAALFAPNCWLCQGGRAGPTVLFPPALLHFLPLQSDAFQPVVTILFFWILATFYKNDIESSNCTALIPGLARLPVQFQVIPSCFCF